MSTAEDIAAREEIEATGPSIPAIGSGGDDGAAELKVAERVRTARFREKLRGYHPDDVDEFLARLAVVVEGLEARLEDALARLEEAEQRAAVATAGEHTVRRTLTLAQRTAELAVAEARERAAAIVAEAEKEAHERIAVVESECAETRARQAGRLEAELARLEQARVEAERRLEVLEGRRRSEHERLVAVLEELRGAVDERLRRER